MIEEYQPEAIETAAQQYWEHHQSFRAVEDPSREKFYCLCMFPYPSGKLHMGHVRNYTLGDVISRYQRMLGKNVLQPMGWDAFGLPAENAAMQHKVPPAQWTDSNIAYMKNQLKRLGFGYDWAREFATCRPQYYRWEQWLFTRVLEQGLAYKASAMVNWDPVDQTVLATEQVIEGRGWRSGAVVERREIPQWFLRITDYAEELLNELDHLNWPDSVKTMQRNWIGRSEGIEIDFPVADSDRVLRVYTTRPDTLFGVSYMAVAAEHPLALAAAEQRPELAAFLDECRHSTVSEAAMETMEKKGMALGVNALHPLTGAPIPIWVANFVLMSYGTGAVMAVPAHDQRDWEFARKYGLPIPQVIAPSDGRACDLSQQSFDDKENTQLVNSGEFDGLAFSAAFTAISERLEALGRGQRKVHYRLRDWLVSRQRYWGAPIPVIYTTEGQVRPTPDAELPVTLPEQVDFAAGGGSPLQTLAAFYQHPEGGRRETDTFDTFMESSWYYARFCSADNDQAMLDERARYWLPVDLYIGGIEHAILHLLYARFYHKVMRDQGLVEGPEPFKRLLTQGMVVAETYYREHDGKTVYFHPSEVDMQHDAKGKVIGARLRQDGQPVQVGNIEKMSKSKNNGVDPQALIERYGADTVRLYTMFAAPPDQSLEWNDAAVGGCFRFLKRIWLFAHTHAQALRTPHPAPDWQGSSEALRAARCELHTALHKTLMDFEREKFNTVVSGCMTMMNVLNDLPDDPQADALRYEGLSALLRLLSPITPHISHTLWQQLDLGTDVLQAPWPQVDHSALQRELLTLVVQVNGKVRARIEIAADSDQASIEQAALAEDNVQRFIGGQAVRKVVVVPGKLVNIVC